MRMDRAVDAGLGRRLAALALDVALALVGFAALNLLLYKTGVLAPPQRAAAALAQLWLGGPLPPAAAGAVALAVLGCWRWLAGTPGALLMGVNVVRARDGAAAGLGRLALRLAAALVLGGLGLLWALGGRAALHDRVSGTRLVIEDERLLLRAADPGPAP